MTEMKPLARRSAQPARSSKESPPDLSAGAFPAVRLRRNRMFEAAGLEADRTSTPFLSKLMVRRKAQQPQPATSARTITTPAAPGPSSDSPTASDGTTGGTAD